MTHRSSRGEQEILQRLDTLDPQSERYRVLKAARSFKASWVGLGEHLTKVREGSLYKTWGYASFEVYCRRELHLRRETANKLTRSFAFLRDHRPSGLEGLEGKEGAELPPLEVVDMLSKAQEKSHIPAQKLATIGRELLAGEQVASRAQVLKRLREEDPQAFRPAPKAAEAGCWDSDLRKALLLSERLESLLSGQQTHVSPKALEGIRRLVVELREQFSAHKPQAGAA